MSAKSTKKAKGLTTPRNMQEIQNEYNRLCMQAGQAQYQINIFTKSLTDTNAQLERVNREAAARQELDNAEADRAKATATTKTETTTEQVAG